MSIQFATDFSNFRLTADTTFRDIILFFSDVTPEQFHSALVIHLDESAALTPKDKFVGVKARNVGEILVSEGFASQDQVDHANRLAGEINSGKGSDARLKTSGGHTVCVQPNQDD
jgi:hypothetical protein